MSCSYAESGPLELSLFKIHGTEENNHKNCQSQLAYGQRRTWVLLSLSSGKWKRTKKYSPLPTFQFSRMRSIYLTILFVVPTVQRHPIILHVYRNVQSSPLNCKSARTQWKQTRSMDSEWTSKSLQNIKVEQRTPIKKRRWLILTPSCPGGCNVIQEGMRRSPLSAPHLLSLWWYRHNSNERGVKQASISNRDLSGSAWGSV